MKTLIPLILSFSPKLFLGSVLDFRFFKIELLLSSIERESFNFSFFFFFFFFPQTCFPWKTFPLSMYVRAATLGSSGLPPTTTADSQAAVGVYKIQEEVVVVLQVSTCMHAYTFKLEDAERERESRG